jgi:predicted nucleotidyltransferase
MPGRSRPADRCALPGALVLREPLRSREGDRRFWPGTGPVFPGVSLAACPTLVCIRAAVRESPCAWVLRARVGSAGPSGYAAYTVASRGTLLFSMQVTILTCMENNPSWLLPLLRSRVTGALLALLYLHPDRDYSLAEAGNAIGASPKVMSTEADRLVTAGLVRETRRGRARLLRAETTGPVSRPLTDLLAVTYGPLPVLSDLLSGVDGVQAAYIYGSWAARYLGEPGPVPHDVDVLVVGAANEDYLYEIARAAEVRLGREVNISVVRPQYWEVPDPADSFMRHVRERPLVELELK